MEELLAVVLWVIWAASRIAGIATAIVLAHVAIKVLGL
jgi:uncharacterized membrane protein YqjE